MLKRVLPYSHELLQNTLKEGDFVIDGTCGNGHDTLTLAKLVGPSGHVLAFDIQEQAIQNTEKLLKENNIENVTLIQDSHSKVENYFHEDMLNNIGGAIFNLGYLPGGDHQIVTKGDTTIKAIKSILAHLKKGRLIVLVVYYGHDGGKEEKDQLLAFLQNIDQKQYHVLQYQFINQRNNPPFLLAIEKR